MENVLESSMVIFDTTHGKDSGKGGVMSEREAIREVSTQEGYALWAASYDREDNVLIALEEARVDLILMQCSFTDVLDVGAGTGRYALKLARQGARVTALDQSAEMLAIARQAALTEGLSLDFLLASLDERLPFAEHHFDLLICALMLCHVPDLSGAIREFARVIRPGGYLLITDFHPDCVAFGWRTHFEREQVKFQLPNMPHTRAAYLDAVTSNGLTLVQTIDLPIRDLPAAYPRPQIMREHEDLALSLIILAQKDA